MGRYLPYAGTNAIQEAVVAIHFRGNFDAQMVERARRGAKADHGDALPRSNDIHVTEIKIDSSTRNIVPEGIGGPSSLAGFEMSKVKADGKPAQILRFSRDILAIHFLVYDRWKTTLPKSLSYIGSVLSHLSLAENPIVAFSLRYLDRFTFDGTPESAHAGLLLRRDKAYITSQCFNGGFLWHCHSGWFEQNEKNFRILNQLNIASAVVDEVPTITIDHNGICQLATPRQSLASTISPSVGQDFGVENILNHLHDRNGKILSDLLHDDMLKRIGTNS